MQLVILEVRLSYGSYNNTQCLFLLQYPPIRCILKCEYCCRAPESIGELVGLGAKTCAGTPADPVDEKTRELLRQQVPGWRVVDVAGHGAGIRRDWTAQVRLQCLSFFFHSQLRAPVETRISPPAPASQLDAIKLCRSIGTRQPVSLRRLESP